MKKNKRNRSLQSRKKSRKAASNHKNNSARIDMGLLNNDSDSQEISSTESYQPDEHEGNIAEQEELAKLAVKKHHDSQSYLELGLDQQLRKKEEAIQSQQREIERHQKALDEEKKNLHERAATLTSKERTLRERELNAEAGFARENEHALEQLEQSAQSLRQQLAALQEQIAQERVKFDKEMNRKSQKNMAALQVQLQQERRTVQKQLQAERDRAMKTLDTELQKERVIAEQEHAETTKQIEVEKEMLQKEKESFEQEKGAQQREFTSRTRELRKESDRVISDQEILEEDRKSLNDRIEQRAGVELMKFREDLRIETEFNQHLKEDRNRLEEHIRQLEEANRRFGHKTPEEVLETQKIIEKENDSLRSQLAQRPGEEAIVRLKQLEAEREKREETLAELKYNNIQLKTERETWLIQVTELEILRDANKTLVARNNLLDAHVRRLTEDINRFRNMTEQPEERNNRIGVIEDPIYAIEREPENQSAEELEWLAQIHTSMNSSGFNFPLRLLQAFHTSLKIAEWAPLTVIAGVSGTGKSEMPRLYSRFGGLQFEPVAIQPNWDSPQDLFGFFNYIDNRFNAKPLLRALSQSQRLPESGDGFCDGLLLVLLDEMNLARVELYFSDLLSKLELRRGAADSVHAGIDLGAGLKELEIPLGRNVLFVGTMNEDETTHALSDKALDRSNIITFPRPRTLRSRDSLTLTAKNGFLPLTVWDSWRRPTNSLEESIRLRYREAVEGINRYLAITDRALGHRVWQAMENYIVNHPEVCSAAENGDAELLENACQKAFEDQIVQKVMPKIRGLDTSDAARSTYLEPIGGVLREHASGLLDDYRKACETDHGTFIWQSETYLES